MEDSSGNPKNINDVIRPYCTNIKEEDLIDGDIIRYVVTNHLYNIFNGNFVWSWVINVGTSTETRYILMVHEMYMADIAKNIEEAQGDFSADKVFKNRNSNPYTPDLECNLYIVEKDQVLNPTDTGKTTSAAVLQPIVATWYKTLRGIALVGLLSVLVYIGIRIIISSTGQEKSKYKKMVGDWLVAICILFILQYIMLFITEICQKVSEVLSTNIIGAMGEDILMSDLRTSMQDAENADFQQMFGTLLIYMVLVIYTVLFTIQYLKRVLYLAFFTMIAPLIALTYPLDKIKDGQAQAWTMWLREYTFNALLQPMHLLLYYMFVSSAINLARSNPLYAVVAIGFLLPAGKFFRKMFGFDKASSAGQLGAATSGALIMNAINKMGQRSGKKAAGGSGGNSGGSGGGSGGSGGTSPRYIPAPGENPGGGSSGGPGGGSGGNPRTGAGGTAFGETLNAAGYGNKRIRSGLKNVAGSYINKKSLKNGAKTLGRMTRKIGLGAAGAATLGTVGIAAGLATGDASNVFKYGAAGLAGGYYAGNRLGDAAAGAEKRIREFAKGNAAKYREGAWGTDEYNTRNTIKELKNDKDFNKACKDFGVSDKEGLIRKFYSNGVTNPEAIKNAINAGIRMKASHDEAIAAAKLNQTMTKSYWGQPQNKAKFISDLTTKTGDADAAQRAADMISILKGDLG